MNRSRSVGARSSAPPKRPAASEDSRVKVTVRCRPLSEKEINDGHKSIVEFEGAHKVVVRDPTGELAALRRAPAGQQPQHETTREYQFDAVFDERSTQASVYDRVCRPIVDSVLEGYNGTIFAYGQTGTGKTYTMEGGSYAGGRRRSAGGRGAAPASRASSAREQSARPRARSTAGKQPTAGDDDDDGGQATRPDDGQPDDSSSAGVIPRAFRQIFEHVAQSSLVQFLIRASYLEIYQEEIHDLLRKDRARLELHERPDTGIYVKDLTSFVCKSMDEIERVMRVGNQNRRVGATDMNEHSSRSHAIFMITIEQQQRAPEAGVEAEAASKGGGGGGQTRVAGGPSKPPSMGTSAAIRKERTIRVGKLNLVDLAGSERQRKTNSFGERQKESIKINLSLSALGNVINSLMKINTAPGERPQQSNNASPSPAQAGGAPSAGPRAPAAHFTPYRDSKLTRLLQDSLGGNAKTLMIANIGPASYNYDETLDTLNYASRAKCIRNRPRLNEDPKDALLRELQREIDELRAKLAALNERRAAKQQSAGSERAAVKAEGTAKRPGEAQAAGSRQAELELMELRQKLASLEAKLLTGGLEPSWPPAVALAASHGHDGGRLLEVLTREQERELERRRLELVAQTDRERAIRDELDRREEAELEAKQHFSSIQAELEAKRRLIRHVLLKIKAMRDEMGGQAKAYRLELDELEQLQYVLQKELKLKCLIMDNFIPGHHVEQLLARVRFDERRNACSLLRAFEPPPDAEGRCGLAALFGAGQEATDQPVASLVAMDLGQLIGERLRGHSTQTGRSIIVRPRSELECLGETICPSNLRYKCENLIESELELVDFSQLGARQSMMMMMAANEGGGHAANTIIGQHHPGARGARLESQGDEASAESEVGNKTTIQRLIDEALNQREPDIVT